MYVCRINFYFLELTEGNVLLLNNISCKQFFKKENASIFSSKSKIFPKILLISFHCPQLGLNKQRRVKTVD